MKRTVVLLILTAACLSACTSSKWIRANVDKQRDFIVALEQQEVGKADQKHYKHPYEIDLAMLEKLMGDLNYVETTGLMNKNKQEPVFQAVEIDRLAPLLVNTLAKAGASQRIRFTSFNMDRGMLFSESRKTEGVIFIDSDGQLNIAFNYINSKRQPRETSAFDHVYSKVNPLKIQTSDQALRPSASYAEFHTFETGKQAPMWVVVDLKRLQEAISTARHQPKEGPAVDSATAETIASPVISAEPIHVPEKLPEEEMKDKLRFLKELLNEGLIMEKDYDAKKNELLDKLD